MEFAAITPGVAQPQALDATNQILQESFVNHGLFVLHGHCACHGPSESYDEVSSVSSHMPVGTSDANLTSCSSYAKILAQRHSVFRKTTYGKRLCKGCTVTDFSNWGNWIKKLCISKCLYYFLAALILASLTSGIFASVMCLQLSSKYTDLEMKMSLTKASLMAIQLDHVLCLPCRDISEGPFEKDNSELQELRQNMENGTKVCCANTTKQMSILLNLFAKRTYLLKCTEDVLKDNTTAKVCIHNATAFPVTSQRPGKVSVFLQAGPAPNDANNSEDGPIRNWISDKPGAHVVGINITDDKVVVPQQGLYFLYSQVAFLMRYSNENISTDITSQSVFQKVYRYSPIYPLGNEELLRGTLTQCWEKTKEYGRYTSYVGASMFLNEGDHIYVRVSRLRALSRDFTQTYFGMFSIY